MGKTEAIRLTGISDWLGLREEREGKEWPSFLFQGGQQVNAADSPKRRNVRRRSSLWRKQWRSWVVTYILNFCLFILFLAALDSTVHGFLWLQRVNFSLRWLPWLQSMGSRLWAQWLWYTGLVAPLHVGSSWTRDWTHVSCTGRRILYHWATREALSLITFSFWFKVTDMQLFLSLEHLGATAELSVGRISILVSQGIGVLKEKKRNENWREVQ